MGKHIYITLDSIYDTRFTILSLLDSKLAKRQIDSDYFLRTADEFEYMSHKFFKLMYSDRTKKVLMSSKLTYMLGYISDYINETKLYNAETFENEDLKVYVNMYPYKLEQDEINRMKLAMLPYFPKVQDIIFLNYENVSPTWIQKEIGLMIDYNLLDWFQFNIANKFLFKVERLETLCLIPKIKYIPTHKMTEKNFEEMIHDYLVLADIQFVDSLYFSLAI